MAKNWWFKFDYKIWRTDSSLRRCSLETRGFWLECLCVMNEMDSYEVSGTLAELARLLGCESNEVMRCATELKQTKTADVTLGNGTVTLVSRRLKRELNVREQTRLRVQRSRSNADVTLQSKSKSKSNKKEEEYKKAVADAPDADLKKSSRPKKPSSPKDERSARPIILAVKELMNRYPDKLLWDKLIARFGDDFDSAKLRECRESWLERGYNANATTWLNWYFDGIPTRQTLKPETQSYNYVRNQPTQREAIEAEQRMIAEMRKI